MFFLRSRVIKIARLKLVAAFIVAYLCEGSAGWFYLHRDTSSSYIYVAVLAHLLTGLSFLLFTTAKPRALPGIGYYYPRIAALFSVFMPIIGLVGISLTLLMARVFMDSHGLAEEYKEKAYEAADVDVDLPTDVTEFLYDEIDVHPIADVLSGDDMGMKRGAVNLLRRIGSAEAVKLLRKSLSDENAEVRFYAHTALTRLEEDYAVSLEKARFKVERYNSAQAHAELAATCRNYARSALPEINMQEQSLEEACEHWKLAVEMDPDNMDYFMRLAEIYTETRKYSEALNVYSDMVKLPVFEMESRLGICRVFFEMGNYIALFQEVRKMQTHPTPTSSDPFRTKVYNFWLESFPKQEDEDIDFEVDEAAYE